MFESIKILKMQAYMFITTVIYLTIGLGYGYEVFRREGRLDDEGNHLEALYYTIAIMVFWPLFYLRHKYKMIRKWHWEKHLQSNLRIWRFIRNS